MLRGSSLSFLLSKGPLLGLGEGGPQFDRKGSVDRDAQRPGRLPAAHARRPRADPVADRHRRLGHVHPPAARRVRSSPARRARSRRRPTRCRSTSSSWRRADPTVDHRASTRASPGFAELPPLWTFGYMQSHRTLAGPDEIMWVARTFREKKLPCDALIYLGTEFTPSGWNTRNGEFAWKTENFPDPKKMHRRAARAALQGRAARRHRGAADERHGARSVHARQGGAERPHAGRQVAGRSRRAVLLAVSQAAVRPRRRRLVAGSGRRPRRAVAARAHPHVLGRAAAVASERAAVRAAPQRRRRACSATARSSGRATSTRRGRR